MQQGTTFLKGWLEIGMSNPNIFQYQSNSDIILRTYDDNATNKIILGNTSSNNTPNCNGAMYILGNNVGLKRTPRSNIALDIDGVVSISSNLNIGTTVSLSTTTITGDVIITNTNTSNMSMTNTSNAFKLTYGNIERVKITNGNGLFLNDNVYVTNDIFASSFHMTSDKTLKHDVVASTCHDDFDKLLKLQVCDFKYIHDTCHNTHKGLIAQEVEKIFPQAVKEYEGIIPVPYGSVELKIIDNDMCIMFDPCFILNFETTINTTDKIVLGDNLQMQKYIVSVKGVFPNMLKIDYSSIPFDISTKQLHFYGILRKIKTIDPNQLLALCISSIQELAKTK